MSSEASKLNPLTIYDFRLPIENPRPGGQSAIFNRQSFSVLGRNCQPEHRNLPLTGHVGAARVLGIGQVQGLAMLAAVDFRLRPEGLLHVPTLPLQHVVVVVPALQVAAAELALGVLFVAGTLAWLLHLD